MTTARTLVTGALDLIGVHAAEEPLSAHQEQQGMGVLNDLIASCSLEHFLIYYTPAYSIAWPPGKMRLTWGIGGDIPTPRPLQLGVYAEAIDPVIQYEWPITVLTQEQYASIQWKELQTNPAQAVYYAPSLPLGELYIYPVPVLAQEVRVYPWQLLPRWADFDMEIELAPGYERFIKSALACDIAPYYDKQIPEAVASIRAESKQSLKMVNLSVPQLETPDFAEGFLGYGGSAGAYDIRRGY